jgi:hypothetical protein
MTRTKTYLNERIKIFTFTIILCILCAQHSNAQLFEIDQLHYITEEYMPFNYKVNGSIKGISIDL